MSLGDLEDVGIELPVSSDAFNSMAATSLQLGRLPKRGDKIQANGYEIGVESVRDNRIVAVRIHPSTTGEFPRQTGTGEAQAHQRGSGPWLPSNGLRLRAVRPHHPRGDDAGGGFTESSSRS